MARALTISLLFLISGMWVNSVLRTNAKSPHLSREEAKHVGVEFQPRKVVAEFRRAKVSKSPDMLENDFMKHHAIATLFCRKRRDRTGKRCSWDDYYAILDEIRLPYERFFDPGAKDQIQIKEIFGYTLPKSIRISSESEKCDEIFSPSASDFLKLVKASHPTIIRGVADGWPALSSWSLSRLKQKWWNHNVVVSISPSGDFDGPEDASLWGLDNTESVVIARPANKQMKFQDFVELSKLRRHENATHYLEYFPLKTLEGEGEGDIPDMKWSNFLSPRFKLLWFGISAVKNPVGRLHYDRFENLMAMVAGSKEFVLYGPDQGKELYAATPLRSAPLIYDERFPNETSVGGTGDMNCEDSIFVRDNSRIDDESTDYHTYSPLDITKPDYEKFPKFKKAKKKVCKLSKGDILYVPADW